LFSCQVLTKFIKRWRQAEKLMQIEPGSGVLKHIVKPS
jgi:hypothetical protein